MARPFNKLTARAVSTAGPGKYGDGGGLWLVVSRTGSKSWVYRYGKDKSRHEMGLGAYPAVTLSEARRKAHEARESRSKGIDPLEDKRVPKALGEAIPTFSEACETFIDANRSGWKNPKHAQQWENTLSTYAKPKLGSLAVNAITIDDVADALTPIWTAKSETAKRVRGRIEAVIDYASVGKEWRKPNPALWRGNLSHKLGRLAVRPVVHFEAMHYDDLPKFMAELSKREEVAAKALVFCVLTTSRTGALIGARWSEIKGNEWHVPAQRMKGGRPHKVPLSPAALALLKRLPKAENPTDYLFPGLREGTHLSNMAMAQVLKRMKVEVTVHGFRSSFKDWASEKTDIPNEVSEAALAHAIGDKVEASYRRGELLEKRRQLMEAWGTYCFSKSKAKR